MTRDRDPIWPYALAALIGALFIAVLTAEWR